MSERQSLTELQDHSEFARRHIGPDRGERAEILDALGLDSMDSLLDSVVPERIRLRRPLGLPAGRTEREVLDELRTLAGRNHVLTSLIGMGYYGTITPPVILRNVMENPGWYTAYTPYQAEVSQGRLEALLIFQQMTAELTGLELANA
jgi:glycine dehydrogenase